MVEDSSHPLCDPCAFEAVRVYMMTAMLVQSHVKYRWCPLPHSLLFADFRLLVHLITFEGAFKLGLAILLLYSPDRPLPLIYLSFVSTAGVNWLRLLLLPLCDEAHPKVQSPERLLKGVSREVQPVREYFCSEPGVSMV